MNEHISVLLAAAAAAPTSAPQPTFFDQYGSMLITIAVIGVIFAFLWRKGYLVRMRDYVAETREELRKCTWPTVEELKGSTVVVLVTITMLGMFTVGVDSVLLMVMRLITS